MSVNRYTQVDWNNPVSSYVPLPLDSIYKAGMYKQKQFEDAVDESYKLNDLMTKVNAIDEHQQYKKDLEKKYYPKIEELANRIVEKGDLTATRDLKRIAREWEHDPLRQELEKSYADYNMDLKDVTKLKQEGNYTDVYDPFIGFKGSNQEGTINPYRRKGTRPSQDYLKVGSDLMKDIAKSGSHGKSYKIDGDQVIGLQSGWEAVYQNDVDRVAQNSLTPFLKSKEGEYFIDEIKHNHPDASGKDIGEAAYNYLRGLGNKQIFKKSESGRDLSFIPEWMHNEKLANQTTTTQSEALSNLGLSDPTKDMSFDDEGNIKPAMTDATEMKDLYGEHSGIRGLHSVSKEVIDPQKTSKQKAFLDYIKEIHPNLKGLNDKEVVTAYRKAIKSVSSESIPLNSISGVAAENIGQAIARNKSQRNFYLYDGKGKTEDGTLETVLKKLDISEEDFDKALSRGIAGYTQAGPSAGSYYVEVKDDSGNSRRVLISADNEIQDMFRTSQSVNDARKQLKQTIVTPYQDMPYYQVEVKPQINKNGDVKWEYNELILNEKGNIIQTNPTTLDKIREVEKEKLKNSNYLGSKVGILKSNTTH